MSWMDILKRKCFYCGQRPCVCTDEATGEMPKKNLEETNLQGELDLKDKETDKEGVLVAGALMGGKDDE